MTYQVINYKDEKQRFRHVNFYDNGYSGQADSHGLSYLGMRNIISNGDKIGLELLLSNNVNEILQGIKESIKHDRVEY